LADEHPEWTLSAGGWRCTVSPFGASLRRLWVESAAGGARDVLWGYSGSSSKRGGQGDVLMPWPGRIRGGRYSLGGVLHELPRNDKDGPNAIHGFLRSRLWEGDHAGGVARFRTRIRPDDHPGYPFDVEVAVGYELLESGLACAFAARNAGDTAAPFGAGFHPYILAGGRLDDLMVRVPASRVVEFDGLLPTGRMPDVPPQLDFRAGRPLGGAVLNHCLTGLGPDPDGFTRVRAGDVELWMDRGFPYLVLYTGDALGADARRALAVEPMTCATDAFNRPEWGLRLLEPGESMAGAWGVTLRPGPSPPRPAAPA
jgi:aldose 1-epimerase